MSGAVFVLLALFWLSLELDLTQTLLERWIARRAAANGKPFASLWFVDLDAERDRDREQRESAVRDNPSLW